MEKISNPDASVLREHYYIPHYAVLREGSTTSRLCVVFNISNKASNSLNDYLLAGPKLQTNFAAVILK